MSNDKPRDPIAEAAEAVRKEAYAAGYKAAITAITNMLAELVNSAPEAGSTYSAPRHIEGGLTVGTTNYYAWQAVQNRPGMTTQELVTAVKKEATKASDAVIRTAISRVKRKRLIVSRHGKWFPA